MHYLFLWPREKKKKKKKKPATMATVQQCPMLCFVIETAQVKTASGWENQLLQLSYGPPFFQTKVKEQESFLLSLNRALRKGTIGEKHFLVFCKGCPHYKSYRSLFKHPTLWWIITFSIRKIWTFICCGEGKHNLPLQVRKDFSLSTPNYIDNDHIPQNILI